MNVVHEIAATRAFLSRARADRRVVFVPTMGALHEGHRACIEKARSVEDALVVVSIFVNPTQFSPGEDLDRYPKPLATDLDICRHAGCDLVFVPGADAMYPVPQRTWIDIPELAAPLCGAVRPGHFRGVLTVVSKLFHIVLPDVAVFGQKDAQQALLIREMTTQLNMPVTIALAATVREADGLALSSRNAYLNAEERARAAGIYTALHDAARAIEQGQRDVLAIEAVVQRRLRELGIDRIEYAQLRSAGDLSALDRIEGRVILAVAVRLGGTRLIDNIVLDVAGKDVTSDTGLF